MYAKHSVRPNIVAFPTREKPIPSRSTERVIYYTKLASIKRKYVFAIAKEFQNVAQLFQLRFERLGETGYEVLVIARGESPLLVYQLSTESVISSTSLEDLNFLYRVRLSYPKLFSSNSNIAFLIEAIESPAILEKL
jgi:hypothetical protein